MTSSLGHQILSKLYGRGLNTLSLRAIIIRFNSTIIEENVDRIPVSQPGKIHAAVLKKFSDPFVIENIEVPKKTKANEVSV